jgi:hypothetical protein
MQDTTTDDAHRGNKWMPATERNKIRRRQQQENIQRLKSVEGLSQFDYGFLEGVTNIKLGPRQSALLDALISKHPRGGNYTNDNDQNNHNSGHTSQ